MTQSNIPTIPPPMYGQDPSQLPPKKPVWPIVIGIISTIWGSLAVLGGIGGAFASAAKFKFGPGPDLYDYAADWYRPFLTIAGVVGLAIAVCLLMGGISLLKRRAVSRPLHLAYAMLAIVMIVVNLVGQIAALDISAMPAPLRIGTIIGFVSIPLGAAYPVFLMIWFSRRKIKDDVLAM